MQKKRLDSTLVDQGLAKSRQRARSLIMAGLVLVDDVPVDKPGTPVTGSERITLRGEDHPYVSRGGVKLEKALEAFGVNVNGRVCLDVGASTGGFTDCLLRHGAQKVFAVDVGYGQIAWKLRQSPRVVVIERTNIRHMSREAITEPVDLATIDVSFISLKIVVPAVVPYLKPKAGIVALIKPQFEAGKGRVGKGGVVRDPVMRAEIVKDVIDTFTNRGFRCSNPEPSPIRGPKGNQEYLIHLCLP
ncbi:RNA binding methyltransferase FtsJ like [Olavius algarvensis associated proteobacterium Delta 3]|nr:RNA binding methyltransferase FtsJ like [Olavius algarvensis associated proteobacterium Delta 3]CAB5157016.1 RNA binding methyltransferase FtsJ like [Olavius algarvensis associated proteobacterium Delta 3]